MLGKFIEYLKIKVRIFKNEFILQKNNLEYRIRRLERAQYWRDKYKR